MTDNGTEPQVTSGALWRKPREEGVIITLPSGNKARLRPVALDVMLITEGAIPDMLSPLAAKTLWTEMEPEQIGEVVETATNMAKLFSMVCKASFLEPKIVDEPQNDDEISIEDIDFRDKAAVFQLALQPAEVLQKFRDQQVADVAVVPAGKDSQTAAKPARRRRR